MHRALLFAVAMTWLAATSTPASASTSPWQAELELGARWLDVHAQDVLRELEVTPALQFDGARLRARGSLRLRWRDTPALDLQPPGRGNYSPVSRPRSLGARSQAELRDFYLEGRVAATRWRLGKQFVNWGTLDGIKVLDVLNPQSFAEFILEDFDDSRISTWGLRVDGRLGTASWDLFWSPDATAHDLADAGTAYALSAPRFGAAERLPWQRAGRDVWGVRLGMYLGAWEIRALAMGGVEQEPVVRVIDATPRYVLPRRRLVGAQFERSFGAFVLRGEAAWRRGREFNLKRVTPAVDRHDQLTAGVGLDVAAPLGLFVNLQVLHDEVIDWQPELLRPRQDTVGTLTVRRSLMRERLRIDARWYQTAEADGLVRFGVTWASERWGDLLLQLDRFHGTGDGLFGQHRRADRVAVVWRKTL